MALKLSVIIPESTIQTYRKFGMNREYCYARIIMFVPVGLMRCHVYVWGSSGTHNGGWSGEGGGADRYSIKTATPRFILLFTTSDFLMLFSYFALL